MSVIGPWWGALSDAEKKIVLDEVSDEGERLIALYMDTIEAALGLDKPIGRSLLEKYRTRPPETWAALQTNFPDDYKKEFDDWSRLEDTEARRGPTNQFEVPPPIETPSMPWNLKDASAKVSNYTPTPQL